jgi:Mce-associated membrane protein
MSSRSGTTVAVLAAALVAAAVLALLSGHRWYVQHETERAHNAAVAAARQFAVDFVTISAASVDADLQRIRSGATGEFAEEFAAGTPEVRAAVVENAVDSQGTVLRAALVSGDRDAATVLVAVDVSVTNVNTPDGRPSHYRIRMDLRKDPGSGQWLVSQLEFVG